MQRVREATLYAREGTAFSVRATLHERAVAETALCTPGGERVYEGDVIELRPVGSRA